MTKTKKKKRNGKAITSEHLALRELRLECEMTLKEAGEKYGLSSKGMGAIENGRVSLNREKIEDIVNSYGLTHLDFIRSKRLIEKGAKRRPKRKFIKTVLKNSDRRKLSKNYHQGVPSSTLLKANKENFSRPSICHVRILKANHWTH
ncbi:helix-turn-helix domain-containing protein [Halobacteriovorax sp. GFR7]|uniref:helix-turn-helix domain-containing protein n=1 Tax=unclassified Halobacteriovorax TaxID=2639665 RepID=UPI003D97F8D5